MSDFSLCSGDGCPVRDLCLRFTFQSTSTFQSWIIPEEKGKSCQYFIPSRQETSTTKGETK